jgi:hypothetical protein
MSAVPMTTTDPLQRAVAFANVFTQAALDAAHAGITPQLISVDKFSEPAPLTVDIQLGHRDTRAVDTLAELYGIDADPGDPLLYARKGHTVMAGDTVAVRVYCTRPLQVVPR